MSAPVQDSAASTQERAALPHVIVIGGGVAGLTCVLDLVERGRTRVTLLTKDGLGQANTVMAQSGVAAAFLPGDTPQSHAEDTLASGQGLSVERSVEAVTSRAVDTVRRLAERGVVWDRANAAAAGRSDAAGDAADLAGLEPRRVGAHAHPRSAHSQGDGTGKSIEFALRDLLVAAAEQHPDRLTLRPKEMVEQLLVSDPHKSEAPGNPNPDPDPDPDDIAARVSGVRLLGGEELRADAVVLAAGGAGQMFSVTTNLRGATGDGTALAFRAGAVIREPEMFQFHPTSLDVVGFPLLGEGVRGDGALIIDEAGERFLAEYDERAELAPRDVVARAMYRYALRTGRKIFIDATPAGTPEELATRFPGITRKLATKRLDWSRPIPVTPSAHYWMGGVASEIDGRTSLPGLFAVGENASTGMHGANRLATNSLLEGAVTGAACAALLSDHADDIAAGHLPEPWHDETVSIVLLDLERVGQGVCDEQAAATDSSDATDPDATDPDAAGPDAPADEAGPDALPQLAELQSMMWERAGVVRTREDLCAAAATLRSWLAALSAHEDEVVQDRRLLELRSLTTCALLLVAGALARRESRGAHARSDHPQTDETPTSRGFVSARTRR